MEEEEEDGRGWKMTEDNRGGREGRKRKNEKTKIAEEMDRKRRKEIAERGAPEGKLELPRSDWLASTVIICEFVQDWLWLAGGGGMGVEGRKRRERGSRGGRGERGGRGGMGESMGREGGGERGQSGFNWQGVLGVKRLPGEGKAADVDVMSGIMMWLNGRGECRGVR